MQPYLWSASFNLLVIVPAACTYISAFCGDCDRNSHPPAGGVAAAARSIAQYRNYHYLYSDRRGCSGFCSPYISCDRRPGHPAFSEFTAILFRDTRGVGEFREPFIAKYCAADALRTDAFLSRVPAAAEGELLTQVTQTVFFANLVVKGILSILAVFLLAYYWTQESSGIIRTLLRLAPLNRRHDIQEFFYLAEAKIGGYVRGQGILCLLVGAAAFILYSMIGLPYTLVLALIAGVMEMVPIVGPALGAVPALLAALSTDPDKVIWVLIATGLIQMMENVLLVPRVMKNSMGVNPIIILLSLVAFSSVFGFAGALLALPLAAIIQLILDRILNPPESSTGQFSEKEADVVSLIDESKRLMHIFDETASGSNNSNAGKDFKEIPESDQLEIKAIAQELGEVLQKLKDEGEAIL